VKNKNGNASKIMFIMLLFIILIFNGYANPCQTFTSTGTSGCLSDTNYDYIINYASCTYGTCNWAGSCGGMSGCPCCESWSSPSDCSGTSYYCPKTSCSEPCSSPLGCLDECLPPGAFKTCGVLINQPWFKINDSNGNDIFIIDSEGDIYFEGTNHNEDRSSISSYESLEIYDLFFNEKFSYLKNVYQNLVVLPNFEGTYIYGNDSDEKTVITKGGDIHTKGLTIYQNSQAACDPDGGYCVGSSLEDRDYYCDIIGGEVCTHDYTSQNCLTKLSDDTDSGRDYENYGVVKDYIDCDINIGKGTDECGYTTYSDSCLGNSLTEHYTSDGDFHYSEVKACSSLDHPYCSADLVDKFQLSYTCGSGQCNDDFEGSKIGDCLYWKYTGCSASCGGGKQTYICTNSVTGATYSDATCNGIIGSKPNIDCNEQACCSGGTFTITSGSCTTKCNGLTGSPSCTSNYIINNRGVDGAHWYGPTACSDSVRTVGSCGQWTGGAGCGGVANREEVETVAGNTCVCTC